MYQALSIFVSIITLAIVSSSTLFITGNNKNIANIKSNSDNMGKQIIANNELTKAQIIAMIEKVNDTDAKILAQHNDIKSKVKKTEYESKSRTENVDSRFKSFKNITNANVIGMGDRVKTNNELIHKRADSIKDSIDDYKISNKAELGTLTTKYDTLVSSHDILQADYGLFQSHTNDNLQQNRDYATDLYNSNQSLIKESMSGALVNSANLDAEGKKLVKLMMKTNTEQIDSLKASYKNSDTIIKEDILKKHATYNNIYTQKKDLNDDITKLYFSNSTYRDLNELVAQTNKQKNAVTSMNADIKDNVDKIKDIEAAYLKTADIPIKVNQIMPSTDIYKDVQQNKDAIKTMGTKVNTNVESIEKSNEELKKMLDGISGGLSGKITLKDLNERIMKNAERIEGDAAKTKLDILLSVDKDNEELKKKINANTVDMKKKITNSKEDYSKAFNRYVSNEMIMDKVSSAKVNVKDLSADNATLSGELIVNGVKFSDLVTTVKASYASDTKNVNVENTTRPQIASYDKDFKLGAYIEPNKPMKLREGVNIKMDDADLAMRYGTMNLSGTNVSWINNNSQLKFGATGVDFDNTPIKVKTFDNIIEKNGKGLKTYVDEKILTSQQATGGIGDKLDKHLTTSIIYPKAVVTPSLFIGDDLRGKINVKTELDKLNSEINKTTNASDIRQNANFYNKSNKNVLFDDIRNDINQNFEKYIPVSTSMELNKVESDSIVTNEIKLQSLNKLTINEEPVTDILDVRYALKETTANSLNDLKKDKPIVDIQLTNNVIEINRRDGLGYVGMIKLPTETANSISSIALDQANNRLMLTTVKNNISFVDLPNYADQIKNELNPYAKKSELASSLRQYAKTSKDDGTGVMYLNNNQKKRLNEIVKDDTIKNLRDMSIPTSTALDDIKSEVTKTKNDLYALTQSNKALNGQIAAKVTTSTLNEQTRLNNNVDNFIRLNNSVSILADGQRLKMCTAFGNNNTPTNCHDLWTTKDAAQGGEFTINTGN